MICPSIESEAFLESNSLSLYPLRKVLNWTYLVRNYWFFTEFYLNAMSKSPCLDLFSLFDRLVERRGELGDYERPLEPDSCVYLLLRKLNLLLMAETGSFCNLSTTSFVLRSISAIPIAAFLWKSLFFNYSNSAFS
jgi:hypothetical protein